MSVKLNVARTTERIEMELDPWQNGAVTRVLAAEPVEGTDQIALELRARERGAREFESHRMVVSYDNIRELCEALLDLADEVEREAA